jgi:hypothetical protein
MKKVTPHKISLNKNITAIDITIEGKSFLRPRNLYLSASNISMFSYISSYNPFISGSNIQKTSYPSFSGIIISEFTIINENILIFNFPEQPKTTGYVDVIMENEAGYGKLTTDSLLPYISSFKGFKNIQLPSISGIEIKY